MALVIRRPAATKVVVTTPPPKEIDLYYNRGESAYEVAKANGFQGSQTEWLASIDGNAAVEAHIESQTPHPAYDDLPSMSLLFENGLI